MRSSIGRSKYEAQLAVASRALYRAAEAAEEIGDRGAQDDCLQIRTELARLMEDSVRGKKRKPRQLSAIEP